MNIYRSQLPEIVYFLQFRQLEILISSLFLLKPAENGGLLTKSIHTVLTSGNSAKPIPW